MISEAFYKREPSDGDPNPEWYRLDVRSKFENGMELQHLTQEHCISRQIVNDAKDFSTHKEAGADYRAKRQRIIAKGFNFTTSPSLA